MRAIIFKPTRWVFRESLVSLLGWCQWKPSVHCHCTTQNERQSGTRGPYNRLFAIPVALVDLKNSANVGAAIA